MASNLESVLGGNRKCLSKIRRCFDLLFESDHCVNDDTLLEKFSSLLEAVFTSNIDDEIQAVIDEGLNLTEWLATFSKRWKVLDPAVVAFGINVISSLTLCPYGLQTLEKHGSLIKSFLESINSTSKINSSILCALLKLYLKLTDVPCGEILLLEDCLQKCVQSLNHSSMYVSRAAKELLVRLILRNLNDEKCKRIIQRLLTDIEASKIKGKQAYVSLDVLLQIFRTVSNEQVMDIEIIRQLNYTLLVAIRDSNDERLINDCCNLILTSKTWISYDLKSDAVWLDAFEILISRNLTLCCSKFIEATLQIFIRNEVQSNHLIALFIFPLLSYCDKVEEDKSADLLPRNLIASLIDIYSNNRSVTNLFCYIISSLCRLHSCFQTQDEKFSLVKMLFNFMSDNQRTSHLLKVALVTADTLIGLFDLWGESLIDQLGSEDRIAIINDCVQILDRRLSQTSMSVRLTKLVLKILTKCCPSLVCIWDSVGLKLKQTIELRCHDPQWETRDSAFELMAGIANLTIDYEFLKMWFRESQLIQLCLIAFDDQQDYVRASAINVLASIPEIGIAIKSDLVQTMGQILLLDSEGIVRRAAASNFKCWLANSYLNFREEESEELQIACKCMVRCCHDLDWEVKLNAVHFWNTILTDVNRRKKNPQELVKELTECGFCRALFILAGDEDSSVRHEVAKLWVRLSVLVPKTGIEALAKAADSVPSEEQCCQTPPLEMHVISSDESILESVLDTMDSEVMREKAVSSTNSDRTVVMQNILCETDLTFPKQFLNRVNSLDCEVRTAVTTDLYELNPESLLDDILTGNYESEHEEDIVIDCY